MAQVSIIVPVYNPGSYLTNCLNSVLAQTCPDWECILVDDGSTDGSSKICDDYATSDARFRVIHQPNSGASAARNTGIDAAQAPYILFLDADDHFHETTVARVLSAQAENPSSFIFFKYIFTGSNLGIPPCEKAQRRYTQKQTGLMLAHAPFVTPWGKLFRKDLIKDNQLYYDTSLACYEDRPFMRRYLRVYLEAVPHADYLLLLTPLYFYEASNPNSLSKNAKSILTPSIYKIFDSQLTDCLTLFETPPAEVSYLVCEYMNTLLYSAWCTPAKERRRQMRLFYHSEEYHRLMAYFRCNRFFDVRYPALALHFTQFAILLDQSRLKKKFLYWKFHWLGTHLFYRSWVPLIDVICALFS